MPEADRGAPTRGIVKRGRVYDLFPDAFHRSVVTPRLVMEVNHFPADWARSTVSAKARIHEGRRTLAYPRPIEHWTARDLTHVIDQIRDAMPRKCPDDEVGLLHPYTAATDRYRRDGRALQHLRYRTQPDR